MATFQPLDFNYQLDPSLVQPPSADFSRFGQFGTGGMGNNSMSAAVNVGDGNTPGNWFSNLFGSGEDGMFSRQSMFGSTNRKTGVSTMGWAPVALGLGQAIFGGIQGSRAMDLANQQFKESKRQFNLNFDAQRKSTNTALEDRQRARVASNAGAYQDVESYMKKNGV